MELVCACTTQEVARLPALAGSRVLFYLSWEAEISDEYVPMAVRAISNSLTRVL